MIGYPNPIRIPERLESKCVGKMLLKMPLKTGVFYLPSYLMYLLSKEERAIGVKRIITNIILYDITNV